MAIWQFRLVFIPEVALLTRYDVLPPALSQELAEETTWWSDCQPPAGFERWIDAILPQIPSWSTSMRIWGERHADEAHVVYVDEGKDRVEEIAFELDVREISPDLLRKICALAKRLGCVFLTADYEILAPDDAMVLTRISGSTAERYLQDPESTLQNLDQTKFGSLLRIVEKMLRPKK